MLPLVCLLLVAAPHVDVTDEVYEIPAKDWRWVEISLTQRTGVVSARYVVLSGAGAVRAALLPKEQMKTLRSGDGLDDFDATAAGSVGELRRPTRELGVYAVVVENRSAGPASVRLRVAIDFPVATTISPQRQLTVVGISFAVFFAIVAFSAKRLLRALKR